MGACCFTPRKSHFLWWYWLALTAVLGIPMLLAAGYARLHRNATEAERPRFARRSAWVFWGSVLLVLVLGNLFADSLWRLAGLPTRTLHTPSVSPTELCPVTLGLVIADFMLGFLVANLGWSISRRLRSTVTRVVIATLAALVWMLLAPIGGAALWYPDAFGADPVRPVQGLLMFAVCWLAAHYWRAFREQPTRKTASWAVAAVVAGAILFQVFSQYGTWWHYQWHRSTNPGWNPPAKEVRYKTQ